MLKEEGVIFGPKMIQELGEWIIISLGSPNLTFFSPPNSKTDSLAPTTSVPSVGS